MGMRSSVVYITKGGKVAITSIQWATVLDRRIAEAALGTDAPEATVRNIVKTIARKFSHVSCVEFQTQTYAHDEFMKQFYSDRPNFDLVHLTDGRVLQAQMPEKAEDAWDGRRLYNSESDVPGGIYKYHLDDGIGLVFRANEPDELEFFWYDHSGKSRGIMKQKLAIADLLDFYRQHSDDDALYDFDGYYNRPSVRNPAFA